MLPLRPRWITSAALLLPMSALFAQDAPAASAKPKRPVTVVVHAINQAPTDTGVRVERGTRLLIGATGTWCMGGQPPTAECGGPGGIRPANPVEHPLVLDRAKIGALIGRIGNGPWFLVGRRAEITARSRGRLFLVFNERSSCCYADNSGSITARIHRLRN